MKIYKVQVVMSYLQTIDVEYTEDDDDGLTRADMQQFYGPSVRI